MAQIIPERVAAKIDAPFVVFLIGMRLNKVWKVNEWLPVLRAMPAMLQELTDNPESGLLHFRYQPGFPNLSVVQYWRSFEHLHAYVLLDILRRNSQSFRNHSFDKRERRAVQGRYECGLFL